MQSALKRDGKPLYEYARKGIVLEREPRKVTIYSIELIELNEDSMVIDVDCSKGTYIRTLAQDIGDFLLSDAVTLEQLQQEAEENPADLLKHLIPLEKVPARWVPEKLLK